MAFALARSVFAYLQTYVAEHISQRVAYDLRGAIYDHLQRLSFAYHDTQQTGHLMSPRHCRCGGRAVVHQPGTWCVPCI